MASQRRKRRSPTTAAPVAGHSSRYLENRRPRFQAPADSNPTRAQYDAGSARSASPLLPTASLGSSVARKNQAAHPLTRRIFLRHTTAGSRARRDSGGIPTIIAIPTANFASEGSEFSLSQTIVRKSSVLVPPRRLH